MVAVKSNKVGWFFHKLFSMINGLITPANLPSYSNAHKRDTRIWLEAGNKRERKKDTRWKHRKRRWGVADKTNKIKCSFNGCGDPSQQQQQSGDTSYTDSTDENVLKYKLKSNNWSPAALLQTHLLYIKDCGHNKTELFLFGKSLGGNICWLFPKSALTPVCFTFIVIKPGLVLPTVL